MERTTLVHPNPLPHFVRVHKCTVSRLPLLQNFYEVRGRMCVTSTNNSSPVWGLYSAAFTYILLQSTLSTHNTIKGLSIIQYMQLCISNQRHIPVANIISCVAIKLSMVNHGCQKATLALLVDDPR